MDNINHFSYSMAKNIYRKGIDYAVALKLGVIEKPTSRALDLGTLVHAHLLGGKQEFVVKQYSDYRSKETREWRDTQTLPIIDESEFETTGLFSLSIKSSVLRPSASDKQKNDSSFCRNLLCIAQLYHKQFVNKRFLSLNDINATI